MYIRWFAVVFIVSLLYACSPYNGGGELTGTRKTKKWFEPQPNIDVLLHKGLDKLKEENFLLKGDKVVIDGGTKVLTDVPTEDLTRNSVIGGVVEI